MNTKRFIASAVAAASLAIGLATSAGATPEDDFWECAAEHQDTDGIGGLLRLLRRYLDDHGQAGTIPVTSVVEADPGPNTPPKRPVLTRLPELSNIDGFAEQPKKPRDALSTY